MSELDEFIQQEEKAMEKKRKRATEQQLQNLRRFLNMEGIKYE